ncbi:MAG: hypothetical protein NTX05_03780 [Fusobacteria bacterium]|nr:hypothetical protein [Fusobacteriota bacterium]
MYSANSTQAGLWTGGKLVKNYNYSIPQMVKALGGSCYEPEDVTLIKEQVDECHARGLKVVVWRWPEHSGSTFDTAMVNKFIDWGVMVLLLMTLENSILYLLHVAYQPRLLVQFL